MKPTSCFSHRPLANAVSQVLRHSAIAVGFAASFAAAQDEDWGEPVAVDGVGGGCPIETRDARSLYVASGSAGTLDIYVYQREGTTGPFTTGPIRAEFPVSDDMADDFCPTPLPDSYLLFVSDRAGPDACGGADIYATRYRPGSSINWDEAVNLGCAPNGPNTAGTELSPAFVTMAKGAYLFYSSNVDGDQDIYRSTLFPDGRFSPGRAVPELNTDGDDRQPNVRRDGLEIVFASNRDGSGQDVFVASRSNTYAPWSEIRNLSQELGFPTVDNNETRPSLSWDRTRLYYGSGGTIFVSERAMPNP